MATPKVGGKPVTRIFLKGNEDLVDSLVSPPAESASPRRALSDLVKEKYHGRFAVEITDEPFGRSDLLLQQLERARPEEGPAARGQEDPGDLTSDLHTRLLGERPDIVVLSTQPDIAHTLWRHSRNGYLLWPTPGWEGTWPPSRQHWFLDDFAPVPPTTVEEFRENFLRIIRHVKARCDAHVIVYNCSSFDPGDRTHNYHRQGEVLAVRVQQFNLALIHLSVQEGISIVDVDRVLAERGASPCVVKGLRYSPEGHQAIRNEFLRVVEDIGFFENRPLIEQIGSAGR